MVGAGRIVPVTSGFVSTRICVPVPPLTVMVPESVLVKEPEAASIAAVPVRCAVKVALLVSLDATRSPPPTPPVMLTRLQGDRKSVVEGKRVDARGLRNT